jgi:adenylate cyclase
MERRVRLVTGLILFAYAASHFLGHATGLFGVSAMESVGRGVILAPWRTLPGRTALFVSLFAHGGLGLHALYRRRHLRMPALEAWQLTMGLAIPFLLTPHVIDVRVGASFFGLDDSYPRILYRVWTAATSFGQHYLLLIIVWVHGCIGLNHWLKRYDTYRRARDLFLAVGVAAPLLAALGLVNAGWDDVVGADRSPDLAASRLPSPANTPQAAAVRRLDEWTYRAEAGYAALVILALFGRVARDHVERRRRGVRVTYPDGRVVAAPPGFSLLEISRWAGVPHASACGGRGRCSTCRVEILLATAELPEPSEAERATLERVKAGPKVRLACQLRPSADLSIVPLLNAADPFRSRPGERETRELLVTALFIDLRDSTRLSADRLPFDALYIVDRYVQRVTDAVEANGGVVTTVAGDGLMCVFGARTDPVLGARNALRAISDIWAAIDALSASLSGELQRPLAFGAGLHTAPAAVTAVQAFGRSSVQILGDAGNIASRLESATKALNCVCVISEAVFNVARVPAPNELARDVVAIRGVEGLTLPVVLVRNSEDAAFENLPA